jgi:hypothetical protein
LESWWSFALDWVSIILLTVKSSRNLYINKPCLIECRNVSQCVTMCHNVSQCVTMCHNVLPWLMFYW